MTIHVAATAAVALAISGILGCAGTPATTAEAPQAAAVPAAALAATSAEPAAMPSAPALAANGEDGNPFPGTHMFKRKNGEVLYCRFEPVAGTRIPKRVCATEEVMRNQAADSRRFIDLVREGAAMTGGCVPGTGSGC